MDPADPPTEELLGDTVGLERDRTRYQARLTALGLDATTLLPDEGGTIGVGRTARVALSVQDLPPLVGASPVLALGAPIGEGGMGVVHEAVQVALDRPVAVKLPHPERDGADARMLLLREARATGAVEHPNVVPVHALGRGERGEPLLVMKRIEGVPWARLLEDAAAHTRYPTPATTPLEFHLGVLLQVCNALGFAHSRGIVHRDVKPDNVMIGAFGEVYVLDWGLAVAVRPDAERWAPPVREVHGVAGTPAYLAPEMAAADAALIGERTDVYLCGAVLHEIVTGRPRHEGATLLDTLTRAFISAPVSYAPTVPRELALIANKATSFNPLDRHESVAAFRSDLTEFLRHAGSRRLAEEAARRARLLFALLDRDAAGDGVDPAALHRASIEARFAFEQALGAWPENADARRELEALRRRLCAHEIGQGHRDAAAALLAEMDAPDAELAERLRELDHRLAKREHEIASLEKLREDTQLGRFRAEQRRVGFGIGAGIVAMVVTFVAVRIVTGQRAGYPEAIGVLAFATVGYYAIAGRAIALENRAQARLRRGVLILWGMLTALFAVSWWLDLDLTTALALAMLQGAGIFAVVGTFVSNELVAAGAAVGVAGLLVPVFPDQRGIVVAVGLGIGSLCLGRARFHPELTAPPPSSRGPGSRSTPPPG
jgi:serine/threonine-protein kinase